jgi:hypothetical protein
MIRRRPAIDAGGFLDGDESATLLKRAAAYTAGNEASKGPVSGYRRAAPAIA